MATTTTRLALRKPDPTPATGDLVNASLDLNANWDKVDAGMGAVACTSGARPSTPFNGQFARETDTGNLILWDGTAWRRVFLETQTPNATGLLAMGRSSSSDGILTGRVNGDANSRVFMSAAGEYWTGGGAATQDTRLRRTAAGEMTLDNGASSGGVFVAGNMPGVQKVILGANTASITFTFTAGVYRSIRIDWCAKSTAAVSATDMDMRINNNSSANYEYGYSEVRNDTTGVNAVAAATTFLRGGVVLGASANANEWGRGTVTFTGISGVTAAVRPGMTFNAFAWVSGINWWFDHGGGVYKNAGPYTSIVMFPTTGNFLAGSEFFFEGIKVP